MYMLDLKFILWVMGDPCKNDQICFVKSSILDLRMKTEVMSQAKTTTNFLGQKNGENLYYKSIIYLERKGGGQFDTFGDFVTEGALERAEARTSLTDTSGWMITVNTYDFVYLAFCVFTENNKLRFSFSQNCLTMYFGRCHCFSHSFAPIDLTDWPRKTSPVRS